jgi:streptogramin lyase
MLGCGGMGSARDTSQIAALAAAAVFGAFCGLLGASEAGAVEPGRLIVTDVGPISTGANGSVIVIDAGTGAQSRLSFSGALYNPFGVAIDAAGDLLVADPALGVGGSVKGRVLRIDGETGAQALRPILGRFLEDPVDIAIAEDGELFVLQRLARQDLVRIDPVTENQTAVFGEPVRSLGNPLGLAIASDGDLLVTDTDDDRVVKLDPALPLGSINLVPVDGLLDPVGITRAPWGTLYVASPELRAVYAVDPTTGARQLVSSFGLFQAPRDVAVAADGMLYVVDSVAAAIFAVHPVTGAQTLVASGGFLTTPAGIAVVPGGIGDADGDAILDAFDVCPEAADLGQEDADGDGRGDACDPFPDDPDDLGRCVDQRDDLAPSIAALEAEQASLAAQLQARAEEQAALLAERDRLLAVDSDGDGVPDVRDECPATWHFRRVDAGGCSLLQRLLLRFASGHQGMQR